METKLDVTIAWAVKVDAAELGASLQAYKDALPTIIALRLCNRFGQGEEAHITRLPIEIVHAMERHVIADGKKEHMVEWLQRQDCGRELVCQDEEAHLTRKEMAAILTDGLCPCCVSDDDDEDDYTDEADQLLPDEEKMCEVLGGCDLFYDRHMATRSAWRSGVMQNTLFTSCVADMVEVHFGLKTWTSLVGKTSEWALSGYEEEDTMTYLILEEQSPSSTKNSGDRDQDICMQRAGEDLQTGVSMQLLPAQISLDSVRKRFQRATNMLGLTIGSKTGGGITSSPTTNPTASATDTAKQTTTGLNDEGPRLMVLSRATADVWS